MKTGGFGTWGARRIAAGLAAAVALAIVSLGIAAPAQADPPPTITISSIADAQGVDNSEFFVTISGAGPDGGTIQLLDDGVVIPGSNSEPFSNGEVALNYPTVNFEGDEGQTRTITAQFTDSDDNSVTQSANSVDVFFYSQSFVNGTTWQDGAPIGNVVVDLLLAPFSPGDLPVQSQISDANSGYSFNLTIATEQDAENTYIIRATYPDGTVVYQTGLFESDGPDVTDMADAQANGPGTWLNGSYETFHDTSWTDNTLAGFQQGLPYVDGVSASVGPTPSYAVTAGALPDGISLDPSTGAITGTPTTAGAYDFTITASGNSLPELEQEFSGTVDPAVVTTSGLPATGGGEGWQQTALLTSLLVALGLGLLLLSRRRLRRA
jgi:Putative Ig domain